MKNKLKEVILNELSKIAIINNFVCLWSNSHRKILNCLMEENILDHEDIKKVLHEKLLQSGRRCFTQHLKEGTFPDHVNSFDALAYSICHNEFNKEEEQEIKFYNSENKDEFINLYGKIALEKLILFVQTEQKISATASLNKSNCRGTCCDH